MSDEEDLIDYSDEELQTNEPATITRETPEQSRVQHHRRASLESNIATDRGYSLLFDRKRLCYLTLNKKIAIWPPDYKNDEVNRSRYFHGDPEKGTLKMAIDSGSTTAVYLEHIRIVTGKPFTMDTVEQLRKSTRRPQTNGETAAHEKRLASLKERLAGIERQEQDDALESQQERIARRRERAFRHQAVFWEQGGTGNEG